MSLDRVYTNNMNNIILNVTHSSIHLQFDRFDSEAITAVYGYPYRVFTVEASTLCEGRRRKLYDRIYADACDVGFYIKSERTGNRELFYLVDTKYNQYEEPVRWTFKPVNQAIKMEIVVYND